jgi:hypothetical protein
VIDPEELDSLEEMGLYAPALIPEVREECGGNDASAASTAEGRGCASAMLWLLCLLICTTLWGFSMFWPVLAEWLR